MRSILGAVSAVAVVLLAACGSTPAPAPLPAESTPSSTTVVEPPPVETPAPAPPVTTTTRAPQPVLPPVAKTTPKTTTKEPAPAPSAYYANCAAAKAAGAAPLHRGEPGYRSALDRDGDGVACEK